MSFISVVFVAILVVLVFCIIFFFKQKTAYEWRIRDWSSDVCSADLYFKDAVFRSRLTPAPEVPALPKPVAPIAAVDELSDEELAAFNDYSALADDQVQDIPEDVLALDRDMPNLTVKDGSMAFDEINFDDIIGPDPTKEEWEGQRRDLVLSEGEEYGR